MEDGDKHKAVKKAGLDVESSGSDDDSGRDVFVNPLTKKQNADKKKTESEEEWSEDESVDLGLDQRGKKKKTNKKETLLGKRKRKGDTDDIKDFFTNEAIEEVPLDDPDTKKQQGYDSMDSDEIAEIRILARKMLRKKARNEILDSTYNRFSANEDPETLPTWFVEDEAKHRFIDRW